MACIKPTHKPIHNAVSYLFASHTTILTGFRSALLRHSFTSVAFSPPAAKLFCSPAIPTSASFTLRLLIAHVVPPFRKASLRFTCIVQPPPYPDGKFTPAASYVAGISLLKSAFTASPSWGLAATFVKLRWLTAARRLQRYSADKCAARLCFFLAAGAFTGLTV